MEEMALKNKYLEAYEAVVEDGIRAGRKAWNEIRANSPLHSMWIQAKHNGQRVAVRARKQARVAEIKFNRRFARAQREAKARLEKFRSDFVMAAGIASKAQLDQLQRRIATLAKRLDGLTGRRPAPKQLKAG